MSSSSRLQCEWEGCVLPRWAPYSWNFCPRHLVENALEIDLERKKEELKPIARAWVRERLCAVLNGYTPYLGDVSWRTNWPRKELAKLAEAVGLSLDLLKEVQWRNAQAIAAEEYPHHWGRADRQVPVDYEGLGSRIVAKTNRAQQRISSDYEGNFESGVFN